MLIQLVFYLCYRWLIFFIFRRCIIKSIIEISFSAFESFLLNLSTHNNTTHSLGWMGRLSVKCLRGKTMLCSNITLAKERFMNARVEVKIIISTILTLFIFRGEIHCWSSGHKCFRGSGAREQERRVIISLNYINPHLGKWIIDKHFKLRPAIVAPLALNRARDWYTKENKSEDVIVRNRVQYEHSIY
jgi:hypothetical protein